jgi:transcriptional regulator with GAF, ATPase, and Fis domain
VFPIHIPPLRERGGDVEHLAAALVRRFVRRLGKRIAPLNDEQLKRLRSYDWPGGVRELHNVIERAIILTSGPDLQLERAIAGFTASPPGGSRAAAPAAEDNIRLLTARELEEFERSNITRALETCGWRISGEGGAARLLGIPPTTLAPG